MTIVNIVTDRMSNLFVELAERLGATRPTIVHGPIYAVTRRAQTVRGRRRVAVWEYALAIGSPLPTPPLWLSADNRGPLELESTYNAT